MTGYGMGLHDQHAAMLAASAVPPDVAHERGYLSVDTKNRLEKAGFGPRQRNVPGLLIPIHGVGGDVVLHQYRPDRPRVTEAGKPVKYETPAGSRMVLDVPPRAREHLGNPAVPLWITEGARKADAAVAAGLCCVALLGVQNWRGTNVDGGKTVLACWDSVALNGRTVNVAFDSDVMTKKAVRDALVKLGTWLESKGAKPRYVYLPSADDGPKVGLDDWLAAGHTPDELEQLTDTKVRPAVDPAGQEPAPAPAAADYSGPQLDLPAVEATFRRWLDLPDVVPLRAVLATYAANRLDGDPVWLLLVGGSGRGKTEQATALAKLPGVHIAAVLTEASLLSGTAKRETAKDATGGLLRKIGGWGVLVLKDFTSILSMNRDARAQVLAALREVYDGDWTRNVGTDGGRTLQWSGKVGVVGCTTSAIDSAHAVIATMGERFVLCRLHDGDGRDSARRAIRQAGHETAMRAELVAAVNGLFARGLPHPPHDLDDGTLERLVGLATLAATARSPVEHDYRTGDIALVLDSEAPTRLGKQLGQLYRAAGTIGIDRAGAWQLVARIALDSIPKLRRAVIEALAGTADPMTTSAVREGVAYPQSTTRRALDELHAHGVVELLFGGGQGRPDRWRLAGWVADEWTAATSPEMSEGETGPAEPPETRSYEREYVFDDISGEVHDGVDPCAAYDAFLLGGTP